MRHQRGLRVLLLSGVLGALAPQVTRGDDLADKIQQMEQQLQEMKRELEAQRAEQRQASEARQAKEAAAKEAAAREAAAKEAVTKEVAKPVYRELLDRVKVGGYGSFRFESNSLPSVNNTFTLRRVVMTTDANIAPRLRSYFEIEYERFRQLELEKSFTGQDGGLQTETAVEGTNDSELSLEQAWLQYDLADWAKLRMGAILVPLGRFNLRHDDNLWDLPRRSLVDRGVPVIPVAAAWDELGAGFNGDIPFSDSWLANYQLYVMNGVSLNSDTELIAQSRQGDTTLNEIEVKVSPQTGTFDLDNKDAKGLSGRFALSPSLNGEIATSFYWGRYTPDFLPAQNLYSISGDGRWDFGFFEVEGEYVYTHFAGVEDVVRGFAQHAISTESENESETLENEVEFELANLATDKQGYWIELRHRFWPAFLNRTVLGSPFKNPQLIGVFRAEQVWLGDFVTEADFTNSVLTQLDTQNRYVNRFTVGLAYRPVPLVVFQLAYEYTQTNNGESLAGVTNYLPAGTTQNTANAILVGTAFGF